MHRGICPTHGGQGLVPATRGLEHDLEHHLEIHAVSGTPDPAVVARHSSTYTLPVRGLPKVGAGLFVEVAHVPLDPPQSSLEVIEIAGHLFQDGGAPIEAIKAVR